MPPKRLLFNFQLSKPEADILSSHAKATERTKTDIFAGVHPLAGRPDAATADTQAGKDGVPSDLVPTAS
jgi:hypothetical protein